jgi:hypothetical protein
MQMAGRQKPFKINWRLVRCVPSRQHLPSRYCVGRPCIRPIQKSKTIRGERQESLLLFTPDVRFWSFTALLAKAKNLVCSLWSESDHFSREAVWSLSAITVHRAFKQGSRGFNSNADIHSAYRIRCPHLGSGGISTRHTAFSVGLAAAVQS